MWFTARGKCHSWNPHPAPPRVVLLVSLLLALWAPPSRQTPVERGLVMLFSQSAAWRLTTVGSWCPSTSNGAALRNPPLSPRPAQLQRPVPANLIGRCFNCLRIDHIAAECEHQARCHREGHIAHNCKCSRLPEPAKLLELSQGTSR
jgi:hypothetical protein